MVIWLITSFTAPNQARLRLGGLAGDDLLNVPGAGERLADLGGIDVQLDARLAAGEQVFLEARRDVQGEGVQPVIHAAVHLLEGDGLRRDEIGQLEGVDDAQRGLRTILVDHRDAGAVRRLGHRRGAFVDRYGERIDDQHQHRRVAVEAAQFLETELEDVAELAAQAAHVISPACAARRR